MSGRNGGLNTVQGYLESNGYQQLTSLGSATGFSSVPAESKLAMIQAESQNVRYRDDGVNPTATVGMLLAAGDMLVYSGKLADIKFIEVSASAKINVIFYK
jgi:hypothetical protein